MRQGRNIQVVIPALNEAEAIGRTLAAIPEWIDQVVVGDNGSIDGTADAARAGGAKAVRETERGYGAACLAAIAALDQPDIVVFVDADLSDDPSRMGELVDPILDDRADLVIGSRVLGNAEPGALTVVQRFGNALACTLMRLFWPVRYTDLGPFRAIRYGSLMRLGMDDRNYGWTVQMQARAARQGLRITEVPVPYRRRTLGRSKVSGTVRGVIGAGTKIIFTIFREALRRDRAARPGRHLIVFTRYPEPGRTKTRMIGALGADGAAQLQTDMTRHTLRTTQAMRRSDVAVEVRYEGGDGPSMQKLFGRRLHFVRQGDGDLGQRMARATHAALAGGAERVVVIGTDCPDLTAELVDQAFEQLAACDTVLGPSKDGGYYLIGLSSPLPALFDGPDWGGEQVLQQTLDIAKNQGISVHHLNELDDVDRPEDLTVWERVRLSGV